MKAYTKRGAAYDLAGHNVRAVWHRLNSDLGSPTAQDASLLKLLDGVAFQLEEQGRPIVDTAAPGAGGSG